jgi:predicted Fe-Mo cluster-binding NifX family protein
MTFLFTTDGENSKAQLDGRFGRARNFLVYSQELNTWKLVSNQENQDAGHGAGIAAAQKAVALGVHAVVSGHFGPKAYAVLEQAGVQMFSTADCTVEEALERYRKGGLRVVTTPGEPRGH